MCTTALCPRDGPCHSAYRTLKGLTQENDVISSATVSLGVSFWARVLPSFAEFIGHQSLRDGGFSANLEPIHEGLSRVFSLAASSSSWSTFYLSHQATVVGVCYAWYGGRVLTRYDIYSSGLAGSFVDLCFSICFCAISLAVAFPSTSSSSSRVLPLKAKSRSPRRSKTSLVLSEPREHGDGVRGCGSDFQTVARCCCHVPCVTLCLFCV